MRLCCLSGYILRLSLRGYAFDPVEFAPGLGFTPIALPIMCRYDDRRVERNGMLRRWSCSLAAGFRIYCFIVTMTTIIRLLSSLRV